MRRKLTRQNQRFCVHRTNAPVTARPSTYSAVRRLISFPENPADATEIQLREGLRRFLADHDRIGLHITLCEFLASAQAGAL